MIMIGIDRQTWTWLPKPCLLLFLLAPAAMGQRGHPGSLLLFPEYDSTPGTFGLTTVTNTDDTPGASVRVRFFYVNGDTCEEFNRAETLASSDTFTAVTSLHNPQHERGYLFVTATDSDFQDIVYNHLIGTSTIVDGFDQLEYTVEPFSFRGIGGGTPGSLTDLNGNGRRDLNGFEYSPVGQEYLIPRFLGQSGVYSSQLVLVDLSGGANFETEVRIWAHNDNGDEFFSDFTFSCWSKSALASVSPLTTQSFLLSSNHNPVEILGASSIESGWLRIDGLGSNEIEGSDKISNPAVVALLVEGSVIRRRTSTHASYLGLQTNGSLLPGGGE